MWKGFLGFFTITIIPGRKRGSSGSFGFARASNTAMLSSLPALAFASEGEGFRWMKSLRPFSPPGKPPVRPKSSFSKVPSSTSTAEGGAGAGGEARGGEGGYSMVVCWSLWWMPRSPLQRSKRSIKERLHGDLGEDFNRSNVVSAKSANTIIALAGNKADLLESRQVSAEEAQSYAQENGLFFMETYAKTAVNVNDIFYEIVYKSQVLQS
ncbi:uncharacterized protein LOC122041253 isoform X3 [Zingiber officinale]|uniref:uncharacterized protein LOC122041253 isoform X3 n=1 Tax=Zingiber officinale TaxID=94328 RepID=UPI001C4DB2C5|nr:uncharacterized protein LOC122041253 isoform X3 [Zingiber officinale]